METNTESKSADDKKDSSTAIAIVLPSIFAIVLIMILAIAFILPRLTSGESEAVKDERKKRRMSRLDENIKAQHYAEWTAKQEGIARDPLCVICLDEIDKAAQIRPLRCCHVFHQACLDDWYARFNEYCPLCHRPIIPGMKEMKKPPEPPPVAFLV